MGYFYIAGLTLAAAAVTCVFASCGGDGPSGPDGDADVDSDSDIDADGDVDVDNDSEPDGDVDADSDAEVSTPCQDSRALDGVNLRYATLVGGGVRADTDLRTTAAGTQLFGVRSAELFGCDIRSEISTSTNCSSLADLPMQIVSGSDTLEIIPTQVYQLTDNMVMVPFRTEGDVGGFMVVDVSTNPGRVIQTIGLTTISFGSGSDPIEISLSYPHSVMLSPQRDRIYMSINNEHQGVILAMPYDSENNQVDIAGLNEDPRLTLTCGRRLQSIALLENEDENDNLVVLNGSAPMSGEERSLRGINDARIEFIEFRVENGIAYESNRFQQPIIVTPQQKFECEVEGPSIQVFDMPINDETGVTENLQSVRTVPVGEEGEEIYIEGFPELVISADNEHAIVAGGRDVYRVAFVPVAVDPVQHQALGEGEIISSAVIANLRGNELILIASRSGYVYALNGETLDRVGGRVYLGSGLGNAVTSADGNSYYVEVNEMCEDNRNGYAAATVAPAHWPAE